MKPQIEIIRKYEDFIGLKNTWNDLLSNSKNDIVFLRHEWFKCWWDAFGKNMQLFIITVIKNNEIIAIAPLMIRDVNYRGLRLRELGFIQNDNSPRSDFILGINENETMDRIINYIEKNRCSWDIVSLKNVSNDSTTCQILPEILKEHKIPFGTKKSRESPFLRIATDWNTYYSEKPSKFRKTLRNEVNRMKRLGDFKIEKISDIRKNFDILSTIVEISSKSWKGKCNGDIARTRENKKFFENLSLTCSRHNWLTIWMLMVNSGAPIAYEYHLEYKNRIYAMRADYDEKYRYYSPGSILEKNIVEHSFNSNISEYDLCGNYYDYKMRWADNIREHNTYELFGFNMRSKLMYQFEYNALPIARKIGLNRVKKAIFRKNENV